MKIGYSKKITKNLGNYESVVIEINVEQDLQYGSPQDLQYGNPQELFYEMKDFVNAKIQEDLDSYISSSDQKNSTIEVKQSVDKVEVKNDDLESKAICVKKLRAICVKKVEQDANNKLFIFNLLSEFGVSKVADLHSDNIVDFKNKLEAL